MATIDIIILIVIGAGAVVGFVKGFIRQLASILGVNSRAVGGENLYASFGGETLPDSDGFDDSCAGVGFYHDLDCRAVDFLY